MKHIEKYRIGFGLLIIIFTVYDSYINKSERLIPSYGLVIIAGLYAIIYYFAKLKK